MNLYRELSVYQKSYRMSISLYKYTQTMPEDERYGLCAQIRRAAVSVPLNIAEGYGKDDSKAELKRYLKMAKGSCAELEVLMDVCKDIGYMESEAHQKYTDELTQISKMLYKLVAGIN